MLRAGPQSSYVEVDEDLLDLVPAYLQRQRESLVDFRAALVAGDLAALRSKGHRLKGSASMYGFRELGELGAALEVGAVDDLERTLDQMERYLATVQFRGRPAS